MNENPLVSVIINCHNGEKFLKNCIKSVLNQSYRNFEIIFWDNRSTDNSYKIAKSFKDKRIKIYKSKKFFKLYKSRNLAVEKCSGKYITFLDTDDLLLKSKIKDQVKKIKKNKSFKMVYSNYFVLLNKKKNRYIKFSKKLKSGSITQDILNSYDIGILTTLIDREIFKHRKFDISYDIIGDFDFFTKLSVENKIAVIQRPLAVYRIHDDNFSSKRIDLYITELSRWLKINKKDKLFHNLSFTNVEILLLKLKIKLFFRKFLKINLGV